MAEAVRSSGDAATELVNEEILRASALVASIEKRSQSLVQTVGGLVTILFALIGFLVSPAVGAAEVIRGDLGAVASALALLTLSIALAAVAGWPFRYDAPKVRGDNGLEHYVADATYDEPQEYAAVALADMRLSILSSIHRVSLIKGCLHVASLLSLGAALGFLAYAAWRLVPQVPTG